MSILDNAEYTRMLGLASDGCKGFVKTNTNWNSDDPEEELDKLMLKWAERMHEIQDLIQLEATFTSYASEILLLQFAMLGLHYTRKLVRDGGLSE